MQIILGLILINVKAKLILTSKNYAKKAVNEVINKIAVDFEKIVAVTKSKELKHMPKTFYQITKNEKHTR